MDESRIDFFRELSSYYIQSRYPEEIEDLSYVISKLETQDVLKKAMETVQWIKSIK